MHRWCRVEHCNAKTNTPYGVYCGKHDAAMRDHGDPEQQGITKAHLKPYIEIIRAKRAKHPDNKAWLMMEAKWNNLVDRCQETLANIPYMNAYNRRGMREIRKVGIHVEPSKVVDTILGMYLMDYLEGRRFKSDQAFRFQLVRRVRGLTTLNSKSWPDKNGGKPKIAYDKLPPKASKVIATLINESLGSAGATIAKIVKEDDEKERQERLEYYNALEGLR
ncbi:hypothetical protein [Methylorubrum extorquens]